MKRAANAVWKGGLKDRRGTFGVESGVVRDVAYDFGKRFADDPGTNPEELIAVAHASCFSMALAGQLVERGIWPDAIETSCNITFENLPLTRSALATRVVAPGADRTKVEEAATAAKAGCPISRVLKPEIGLELTAEV
jgi:osmotically inducible protein OsmC